MFQYQSSHPGRSSGSGCLDGPETFHISDVQQLHFQLQETKTWLVSNVVQVESGIIEKSFGKSFRERGRVFFVHAQLGWLGTA